MHSLRIDVVYPDGYSPNVASCGVIDMYPIIDDTHPIKIGIKLAGTHTSNCRTQDLVLPRLVFESVEKAEAFCEKALPCMKNDNQEAYSKLVDTTLKSGDAESVGKFYYR